MSIRKEKLSNPLNTSGLVTERCESFRLLMIISNNFGISIIITIFIFNLILKFARKHVLPHITKISY